METQDWKYEVRKAKKREWEDAMALAWRTFQKYEAKEYTPEGIRSFENFISDNRLYKMFLVDKYLLWVAVSKRQIIGMISARSKNHISLLFVDEKYHKNGIGTELMHALWTELWERGETYCTVDSAPYAVDFYHKLGFVDSGVEHLEAGMIITPMYKNLAEI